MRKSVCLNPEEIFHVHTWRCLCVTVRFSERIAARSLFTEYGEYVGAGVLTAAYIAERAETFIPNAAARMARYF